MVEEGKIVEKVSYIWRVQNYKEHRNVGYGVALESPTFDGPNGHSFKIKFYPAGATETDYINYSSSFAIETKQTAELLLSFHTVNPYPFPIVSLAAKTSSFRKRGLYRRVLTVQGGHTSPSINWQSHQMDSHIGIGYSLKIKATIGVFINTIRPPIHPFLFFRVDDQRFFAERSIIQKRCPPLLPKPSSDADIVISDVEPDLFDALLWFIYNKKLHSRDQERIMTSKWRDPNSYRMRIRRVAIRYELMGFTGDSGVYMEDLYRPFLKAWNIVQRITKVKSKVAKVMLNP
ncbi:hypothetical protein SASPL_147553 [Salvia splendens]|uniref:BTB domain-containing protein n=1 Tax=Salvia splendens TaxID=180675 RepID=A0A8X8Z6T5_SALSN|nr:uncharacterized protein LOC121776531 [Salvia splendens]KAG6393314.1 hypothetical protein SASPL_147553 [Salvia splendens]